MTLDTRLRLALDGEASVVSGLGRVDSGLDKMAAGIQRIGHYGAAYLSLPALQTLIGSFVRASDNVTQLGNQLKLATGSANEAAAAYARLYTIAQQSRLGFAELGGTYARIARSTSELGISQARLLTVTKAIGDAVLVSGSSAEAANAALVQLGQGMAAGALRGEELNSVMEQTPRLARAIADGLGVTIGKLREMGQAGELTAQRVIAALESQAGVLGKEVAGSVGTVAQAVTQLGNAVTLLIGQLNKTTGASSAATEGLGVFARGAQAVAEAMALVERSGGGRIDQLLAGAGMLAARGAALQLLSRDFMTLQGAVDDARATIDRLDKQEQRQGRLSIYLMDERARAYRDLARAQRMLALLQPSADGAGSVRSGDTALAAALATDERRRQALAKDLRAKLATPQEKFEAELARQRSELGDLFTPDIERRLREHYIKPTDEAGKAARAFTDSLRDQIDDLREQVIEMTAGAEAALAFRAAQLGIGDATATQRAEVAALTAAVKHQADEQAKAKQAAEARAKADADALRALVRYGEELDKQVAGQQQTTQALRDELLALTAGEQALKDLTAARAEEAAVAAERLALARYDLTRDDEELRKLQAIARELRNQAALRRQIGDAAADKEATQRATDEWQRASDQIGQSLADALMGGAQSAAEAMKNLFRTIVLRPVIQAVVNPVAGVITSLLGFSGPANAAGGNLGGLGSLFSLAGGASSTFGAAFGAGVSGTFGGAGLGGLLGAAGELLGGGSIAGGLGVGLGAIAPYAAAVYAAIKLAGGMYDRGWKAAGVDGVLKYADIPTVLTNGLTKLGLNEKWANILTGAPITARLFGRKLADTGVQGTFSGTGDFTGNAYAFHKGGWFRSDKTTTSPLDEGLGEVFDAGATAVSQSVRGYAEVLGLPVQAIDSFRQQIQLSFHGLNDEQIREKIAETVKSFGDGLIGQFRAQLDPFVKAGETLAQTFERLAGIQNFSRTLNELGGVFERVAWLSIDAREHLFELAGGMQALGQQAMQFVQDYYGRDEIAGIKADEIQARLAAVGITQDIGSREQFRSLVESIDVSSAKGREQLATLLAASGSFTGLSDYLAETGLTLQQAAAQAPDAGPLPGLFGPGGQLEQISAINNVALSVDRVYGAVMEVVGAIKAQPAPAPTVVFQPWEVGGMAVSGGT